MDRETLDELYWGANMTQREIAAELDISRGRIQHLFDKYDIETRNRGQPADQPYKNRQTLVRLYIEIGLSSYEIGDRFGVTSGCILNWLRTHNIPRRRSNTEKPVYLRHDPNGYVQWYHGMADGARSVMVHQLLAISEGADPYRIFGGDLEIHHLNGVVWDNRPENIVALSKPTHAKLHSQSAFLDELDEAGVI